MLMFSAKKITPEKAQPHCLNIGDFVSKPVNPAQLPDAIKRVFEQRANVNVETLVAKNAGFDAGLVEEYVALRKFIDVNKNLRRS
jgi:DNA-binding NtrC family response regulator